MDDLATTLIVEVGSRSIRVTLGQPLTLAEVYDRFSFPGRRPPICTLSGEVAIVSF